jgi:hypothetical protein
MLQPINFIGYLELYFTHFFFLFIGFTFLYTFYFNFVRIKKRDEYMSDGELMFRFIEAKRKDDMAEVLEEIKAKQNEIKKLVGDIHDHRVLDSVLCILHGTHEVAVM